MNEENIARRDALRRRFYIRDPYVPHERRHKFAIGQRVGLIAISEIKRPREAEREILGERFEIMRLLPQQDRSFQYRIKDVATGHERVVAEESIVTKD